MSPKKHDVSRGPVTATKESISALRRPKKRQRLHEDIETKAMDVDGPPAPYVSPSPQDEGDGKDGSESSQPSSSPPSNELPLLPVFPMPTQPAAPSPSVLYLQGLDRAIIEAKLIDSSTTVLLDSTASADPSGLSLKTRQRLAELGINGLFSGSITSTFELSR